MKHVKYHKTIFLLFWLLALYFIYAVVTSVGIGLESVDNKIPIPQGGNMASPGLTSASPSHVVCSFITWLHSVMLSCRWQVPVPIFVSELEEERIALQHISHRDGNLVLVLEESRHQLHFDRCKTDLNTHASNLKWKFSLPENSEATVSAATTTAARATTTVAARATIIQQQQLAIILSN